MDIKQIQDLISRDPARQVILERQRRYADGKNVSVLDRTAHEQPDGEARLGPGRITRPFFRY
jgi:hypothetical protein